MSKPLSPSERKQLGEFLGGILRGQVTLGLGSLGLVDLYHRARAEKLSILDLALEDGPTQEQLVNAIAHRIKLLPPKAFNAVEHAVLQARMARQGIAQVASGQTPVTSFAGPPASPPPPPPARPGYHDDP